MWDATYITILGFVCLSLHASDQIHAGKSLAAAEKEFASWVFSLMA